MAVGLLGNSKNMNVLVVGYGSIGKRHVLNLTKLDSIDEIVIYTKIKNDLDKFHKKKVTFIDASNVTLNDACKHLKIDIAIIANETFKHIDTAIILAEQGINLFIEKPLSHSLEKVETLKEIAERKKIKVFVAYNLRFLGVINLIKKQIMENTIGRLYFAKIEVGQYLPSWRPDRDYRKSYSAKKDHGGGVALDLSHEIDYMRYLFGDPCDWHCVRNKVSDLAIDSDDIFEAIYEYDNGFVCNTHMDYLQMDKKRNVKIVGSKGTIECDFIKKYIKIFIGGNDELLIEDQSLFDIDKTYIDELTSYIESIEKDNEPLISLNDGAQALRLIEDKNV